MPTPTPAARPDQRPPRWRLGCVSFLNARPLIEGLDDGAHPLALRFDVPSTLLADLESRRVDIALCPVIDYYRSRSPLVIVPAGGIGCEGPTLTVRLASRVPIDRIDTVHADTDSHTSVVLLQVLLHDRWGRRPRIVAYDARVEGVADTPESVLLIGDKVVQAAAAVSPYDHQLDLGQAWHELTGLPFVFAVWMTRQGRALGRLPAILADCRARGVAHAARIADRDGPAHGWPPALARQYLGRLLRYEVGERQLAAIEHFAGRAHALGLIGPPRSLRVRGMAGTAVRSGAGLAAP